jgi:hypothetical protein
MCEHVQHYEMGVAGEVYTWAMFFMQWVDHNIYICIYCERAESPFQHWQRQFPELQIDGVPNT